jgi:hypothetical protein
MPAASTVAFDPAGLDTPGERAGEPEPDPSCLWYPDGTPTSAELLDAERLTYQPESLIDALPPEGWIPKVLRTLQEVGECLSKIPEGLLLNNRRTLSEPRKLGPNGGQLPALLSESDRAASWPPP